MKKILFAVFSLFGFNGRSLDKIISLLTDIDAELEAFESRRESDRLTVEQTIKDAEDDRRLIEAELAHAGRIREKVQTLVA